MLERAPRVCLAFAGVDGPRVYPVKLAFKAGRCQVYLPALKMDALPPEAVLLVDEGVYYFDLRAIYIRGALQPAGEGWFELVPTRTVAWDYGLLRWVESSAPGGGSDEPG